MAHESFLSTRIEVACPRCSEANYRLLDVTDVLAERPVTVEVRCPRCGKEAHVTLFESGHEGRASTLPHAPETEAAQVAAGVGARRSSQTALSGVALASRYSLRAEDVPHAEATDVPEAPPVPSGRSCA